MSRRNSLNKENHATVVHTQVYKSRRKSGSSSGPSSRRNSCDQEAVPPSQTNSSAYMDRQQFFDNFVDGYNGHKVECNQYIQNKPRSRPGSKPNSRRNSREKNDMEAFRGSPLQFENSSQDSGYNSNRSRPGSRRNSGHSIESGSRRNSFNYQEYKSFEENKSFPGDQNKTRQRRNSQSKSGSRKNSWDYNYQEESKNISSAAIKPPQHDVYFSDQWNGNNFDLSNSLSENNWRCKSSIPVVNRNIKDASHTMNGQRRTRRQRSRAQSVDNTANNYRNIQNFHCRDALSSDGIYTGVSEIRIPCLESETYEHMGYQERGYRNRNYGKCQTSSDSKLISKKNRSNSMDSWNNYPYENWRSRDDEWNYPSGMASVSNVQDVKNQRSLRRRAGNAQKPPSSQVERSDGFIPGSLQSEYSRQVYNPVSNHLGKSGDYYSDHKQAANHHHVINCQTSHLPAQKKQDDGQMIIQRPASCEKDDSLEINRDFQGAMDGGRGRRRRRSRRRRSQSKDFGISNKDSSLYEDSSDCPLDGIDLETADWRECIVKCIENLEGDSVRASNESLGGSLGSRERLTWGDQMEQMEQQQGALAPSLGKDKSERDKQIHARFSEIKERMFTPSIEDAITVISHHPITPTTPVTETQIEQKFFPGDSLTRDRCSLTEHTEINRGSGSSHVSVPEKNDTLLTEGISRMTHRTKSVAGLPPLPVKTRTRRSRSVSGKQTPVGDTKVTETQALVKRSDGYINGDISDNQSCDCMLNIPHSHEVSQYPLHTNDKMSHHPHGTDRKEYNQSSGFIPRVLRPRRRRTRSHDYSSGTVSSPFTDTVDQKLQKSESLVDLSSLSNKAQKDQSVTYKDNLDDRFRELLDIYLFGSEGKPSGKVVRRKVNGRKLI